MFRRNRQDWMDATGAPRLEALRDAREANAIFGQLIYRSLDTTHRDTGSIRILMRTTYFLLVLLYVAMFVVGIILIVAAFVQKPDPLDFQGRQFLLAGLGGADLLALGLLQPTQKIKHLMGDMAQLSILMNDHQHQALLRLIQMDKEDRASIGKAADAIQAATKLTVDLIERYFTSSLTARVARQQVARTQRSVDEVLDMVDGLDPEIRSTLSNVRDDLAAVLDPRRTVKPRHA